MSKSTHDLLIRGTAAARVGDNREAHFYLEWLLTLDPDEEEKLEALYWLAKVSPDQIEKRRYLEDILASQPHHYLARREWMILEGKLSPQELIDPNHLQQPSPTTITDHLSEDLTKFTCPNCGGRMVYSPDGVSLVCEYCEVRERQHRTNPSIEQDFLLSLSTIKGHSQPVGHLSIKCQQCGAVFILAKKIISMSCPYCNSVYVVEQVETRSQSVPSAIFPAQVSDKAAIALFNRWRKQEKMILTTDLPSIRGIYLPIWWFSMGGALHYRYQISSKNKLPQLCHDSRPILRDDLCVPASNHHQKELEQIIDRLDFQAMVEYRPDYLADWFAETYQVTVANASLVARQLCLDLEKQAARQSIPSDADDLIFDSHDMVVESYQLCLVPVWMGEYQVSGERKPFLINAISGEILFHTDKPGSIWERLIEWENE